MAQKIKSQLPSDAELRDIIAQAERMRAETLTAMFRASIFAEAVRLREIEEQTLEADFREQESLGAANLPRRPVPLDT
jgi:hypothetical protein